MSQTDMSNPNRTVVLAVGLLRAVHLDGNRFLNVLRISGYLCLSLMVVNADRLVADNLQKSDRITALLKLLDSADWKATISDYSSEPDIVSDLESSLVNMPADRREAVQKAIEELKRLIGDRLRTQSKSYSDLGRIDLLIQASASIPDSASSITSFEPVTRLLESMLNYEVRIERQTEYWKRRTLPIGDLPTLTKRYGSPPVGHSSSQPMLVKNQKQVMPIGEDRFHFLRTPGFVVNCFLEESPHLLVSAGDVEFTPQPRGQRALSSRVILSNGNIHIQGGTNSILIADGDVLVTTPSVLEESCVIARGSFYGYSTRSLVAVGKDVSWDQEKDINLDLPAKFRIGNKMIPGVKQGLVLKEMEIRQNVPKPFGFVKFFEAIELGIDTVLSTEKRVVVQILEPKLLFGQAGFRKDDLVESVNGKPVASPEAFRKMVRTGIIDTKARFVLKRGGETIKIEVKFPLDCLSPKKE